MSSKDIAVSVRGLSKSYTIAHNVERATTLGEAFLHRMKNPTQKARKETFWALRDVSFDIQKGDVVGVIGRNGAGKSTLLKILSQITEPTAGEIYLYGRVGSLLEVGTGFHPELTGRENIYLNGAILGMRRKEIERQFDAIVDFAEVEQFLDTPVKRYSSGMYVRLAFGVAAHLNPEILIVDEVLAVGDATFQKKCIGKMEDVAKEGRTVLFVSHNMGAISTLCSRAIFLSRGQLALNTDVTSAVNHYLANDASVDSEIVWEGEETPQTPEIRFIKAYILNDKGERASTLDSRLEFSIVIEYEVLVPLRGLRIGFALQNSQGTLMCSSNDASVSHLFDREPGHYINRCRFPGYVLNAGRYSLCFGADLPPYLTGLILTPYCVSFTVEDVEGHGANHEKLPGVVRPKLSWMVNQEMAQ